MYFTHRNAAELYYTGIPTSEPTEVSNFECLDWKEIRTPIKVDKLKQLLIESNYDKRKSQFLVDGFTNGFDLGYRGPIDRTDESDNIPLRIGSETELWNKVMKEVQACRYAGPYKRQDLPFDKFIQSPIGLVPKAGNKTRLIFHLSYDFTRNNETTKSVNYHTPDEMCTVKYRDLDYAIKQCIGILRQINWTKGLVFGKSDLSNAFRLAPMLVRHRCWLVIKARNPITKIWMYFIDKCMPFGASISCAIFQQFSDGLKHILDYTQRKTIYVLYMEITNYLDDFLFISITVEITNKMIDNFLQICDFIGCPVSEEKTERATGQLTFLGMLLDGQQKRISVPTEKVHKALQLLHSVISRNKITIKTVQCLTGTLNFLNRAIVPGRAFTRMMYTKLKIRNACGELLRPYHHVNVNREFRRDCLTWTTFLENANSNRLCRPFVDWSDTNMAKVMNFTSDASRSDKLGMGAVYNTRWMFLKWDSRFIKEKQPSIEFLELYALTAAVLEWGKNLQRTAKHQNHNFL